MGLVLNFCLTFFFSKKFCLFFFPTLSARHFFFFKLDFFFVPAAAKKNSRIMCRKCAESNMNIFSSSSRTISTCYLHGTDKMSKRTSLPKLTSSNFHYDRTPHQRFEGPLMAPNHHLQETPSPHHSEGPLRAPDNLFCEE